MADPSVTRYLCVSCPKSMSSMDSLEAHIAAQHLDYFPYGCGFCSHWMATERQAEMHCRRKNHLPPKIREVIDEEKETELRLMLTQCQKTPVDDSATTTTNDHEQELSPCSKSVADKSSPCSTLSATQKRLRATPTAAVSSPSSVTSPLSRRSETDDVHPSSPSTRVRRQRGESSSSITLLVAAENDKDTSVDDEATRLPIPNTHENLSPVPLVVDEDRELPQAAAVRAPLKRAFPSYVDERRLAVLTTKKKHRPPPPPPSSATGRLFPPEVAAARNTPKTPSPSRPAAAERPRRRTPVITDCCPTVIARSSVPVVSHRGAVGSGDGTTDRNTTVHHPSDDDDGDDDGSRVECNLCDELVVDRERAKRHHAEAHVNCAHFAKCRYCKYSAAHASPVQTHIKLKHPGLSLSRRLGNGVVDVVKQEDEQGRLEDMYTYCFFAEPALSIVNEESSATRLLNIIRKQKTPKTLAEQAAAVPKVDIVRLDEDEPPSSPGLAEVRASLRASEFGVTVGSKRLLPSPPPSPQHRAGRGAVERQVHINNSAVVSAFGYTASGRIYRILICQLCGEKVRDNMTANHVYLGHIRRPDVIRCAHCDYGSMYLAEDVKRHHTQAHPHLPFRVHDNKKHMATEYIEWRTKCFPTIGTGNIATDLEDAMRSDRDNGSTINGVADDSMTGFDGDESFADGDCSPSVDTNPSAHDRRSPSGNLPIDRLTSTIEDVSKSRRGATASSVVRCKRCQSPVAQSLCVRHVYKHLAEELNLYRYRCPTPGCAYATQVKRFMDRHLVLTHRVSAAVATSADFVQDRLNEKKDQTERMHRLCFPQLSGAKFDDTNSPVDDAEHSGNDDRRLELEAPEDTCDSPQAERKAELLADRVCNQCGEQIACRSELLSEHVWDVHVRRTAPFVCRLCEARLASSADIAHHLRVVHGVEGDSQEALGTFERRDSMGAFEREMTACFPPEEPTEAVMSAESDIGAGVTVKVEPRSEHDLYDD